MRNLKQLLAVSAIVFLALSCTKEVKDNPNYNEEAQEVTAEFVLNVSTEHGGPATKMTADVTQYNGNFRGMESLHLITYSLDNNNNNNKHWLFKGNGWDASAKGVRDFTLGTILADEISENQTSKVFQISLPLTTNTVLMYGRARRSTANSDYQGKVSGTGTYTGVSPENISFELANRMTDEGKSGFAEFGDMMGMVLTGLLTAGKVDEDPEVDPYLFTEKRDNTYAFWWPMNETSKIFDKEGVAAGTKKVVNNIEYTFYKGSKTWRDYGLLYKYFLVDHPTATEYVINDNLTLHRPSSVEEVMGYAYYAVTNLSEAEVGDPENPVIHTELRSASSRAVLRLVQDVFGLMAEVIGMEDLVAMQEDPENFEQSKGMGTPEDQIAYEVAKEVIIRAQSFFDGTPTALAYQPFETFKANFIAKIPGRDWNTQYPNITKEYFYSNSGSQARPGFPMNLGMPEGTAIMNFRSINTQTRVIDFVYYPTATPDYMMGGTAASTLSIYNYYYPAELVYWTNSSIKTNDKEVQASAYPHTHIAWNAENWSAPATGATWYNNSNVSSSTRSVAVEKELNYGVALLKSNFKYGAAEVYDNNSYFHDGEPDKTIDANSAAAPFKITGMIIGGVDPVVGWDLLSKSNDFSKVVYDKFADEIAIPAYNSSTIASNFTLLWDNYASSLNDQQAKVYVALELVNNTNTDFWGETNLIHPGMTFYLVGLLNPSDATVSDEMKKNGQIDLSRTNCHYPPYDTDGSTLSIPRIFMQDFVTEATFVFGRHSLAHAYVTMPDLRASNVSLGLSVDLKWTKGYTFENVVLGDPNANNVN